MVSEKSEGFLSKLVKSLGETPQGFTSTERYEVDGISIEVTAGYQPSGWVDTSQWPDERVAICPSCEGALKKVPGAKTKCPNCGEFVYVRTDPRSKSRRVVNESELEDIEDAWAMQDGTYEARQDAKREREIERDKLTGLLGRAPSEAELDLHLVKIDLEEHLQYRQMGLVRNDYLSRGQIEFKEGNFHAAALGFLAVVLLDGNGATNALEIYEEDENGNEIRSSKGTGFSKRDIMYLPYLAKELGRCVSKGGLSGGEVLRDFESLGLEGRFGCTTKMDKVWARFVAETGCTFSNALPA